MKNLSLTFFALSLVGFHISLAYHSSQQEDPVVIPDANFKAALLANNLINTNEDDEISLDEASSFSGAIVVDNLGISDLTGIEAFVSVTQLICWGNQLTSLNISANVELTLLWCHQNLLTSLDLSANTKLKSLLCYENQLSSLDLTNNVFVEELFCESNSLASLDISNNTALKELRVNNNLLEQLDLSQNTELISLFCNQNQLTSLDVGNNTKLIVLRTYLNPIGTLDVSECLNLQVLWCWDNQLQQLDLSQNVKLEELHCSRNQISSLGLTTNSELLELTCDENQLTTLDISNNLKLEELRSSNNLLKHLDLSKNTALKLLACNNNQLTSLNLQNGSNEEINLIIADQNPDLSCVTVDDPSSSRDNWFFDENVDFKLDCSRPFITTWKTDNQGSSEDTQITIPVNADESYNYDIYWEEIGNASNYGSLFRATGITTIDFPTAGTYRVEISGVFPQINFFSVFGGDREKLITIEQWGDISWSSMERSFYNCANLTVPASDAPDLTNVTSLFGMFEGASSFNDDIGYWDVSEITDMSVMFSEASSFNQNLSAWKTGNVTKMSSMFSAASSFDQPIGNWNVSQVTSMAGMFSGATNFNQDLGSWDVANVTNMNGMFRDASSFDQNIGGWDVSKVTGMHGVFDGATSFNHDIGSWNVENVTQMSYLFSRANSFNQDIGGWNVGNVVEMKGMFSQATSFNQDVSAWDVGNVTNMEQLFLMATEFNQDIHDWDVSQVKNMSRMFEEASAFNHDIGNWEVGNVEDMSFMFRGAAQFDQYIGDWDVSNVTSMAGMFNSAASFNQDIRTWDVKGVRSMFGTFSGAVSFDQDISSWAVDNVENFQAMFNEAISFNIDLSGWSISSATNLSYMFSGAAIFNQDISSWDVSNVTTMRGMFQFATSFDQNIGSWDISEVTSMHFMFSESGLSDENYDHILIAWSSLSDIQSNVALHAEHNSYCSSADARQKLIDDYGWGIWDNGPEQEAPIADIASLPDIIAECSLDVAPDSPTATDDCHGQITGSSNISYPITNSTTITWTYTDLFGNSSTQDQEVIINDVTAPIPDMTSLIDLTDECELTIIDFPTATDNCDGSIMATTDAQFPISNSTVITWIYTDAAGNSSTQTQEAVVADLSAPVPDEDDLLGLTGECELTITDFPTATDNCDGTIEAVTDTPFPVRSSTTITWTYIDGSGNSTAQTQEVVIADISAPIPDQSALSNLFQECELTFADAPTATDNCDGSIKAATDTEFPITTSTTIIWTYLDASGNSATQTQEVTISDLSAPVADQENLPALTGECALSTANSPTATDNCDGSITATTDTEFPITTSTTITWTYVDDSGNSATQTQDVTIADVSAPIADQENLPTLTEECALTTADSPTATDNCDGSITATADTEFPITTSTTITWMYLDASGNSSVQTQDVVIADVSAPVPNEADLMDLTGECELTITNFPTATDNCDGLVQASTETNFPITEEGTAVITWMFTDAAGNTSTQTQNVLIECEEVLSVSGANDDIQVYPNPTSNFLYIKANPGDMVSLIDLRGNLIDLDWENGKVDISSHEAGVYILMIKNKEGVAWVDKIIKN